MSKKQLTFEIGKFYKKSEKDRTWTISILEYKYGSFKGICIKESKQENYITDADIFLEPCDCKEITADEFEKTMESVINQLKYYNK